MSYLMKNRLSSFFSAYNNCAATPAMRKARKVLFYKAFRASFTLVASHTYALNMTGQGGERGAQGHQERCWRECHLWPQLRQSIII